ncbi:MAG: DUF2513 domain-containing protein [Lachnospiraceae bacterium]|nr:DUF2513 domain-containing protein [Lachnospiraceae bacterium]
MKLNIDCVRDVLLQCEEIPLNGKLSFKELVALLSGYSEDDLTYTCIKLHEAGYLSIVYIDYKGKEKHVSSISDISFQGHEFLNNIKDSSVWNNIKNVGSKVGATSISAFTQIATGVITALIKSQLGL